LLLFALCDLTAQEVGPRSDSSSGPWYLEVFGGPAWGVQNGEFPVYGSPGCGLFSDGHISIGTGSVGIAIPDPLSLGLDLHALIRYEYAASSYRSTPLDVQTIFDSLENRLIDIDREFRYRATVHTLALDLRADWNLGRMWRLSTGIGLGVGIAEQLRQVDTILGPAGRSFPDGESAHSMPSFVHGSSPPFSVGVSAAIGWGDIALPGLPLKVRPQLFGRVDLRSQVDEYLWTSFAAGFGISAFIDFSRKPAVPEPVAIAPPDSSSPEPPVPPSASIVMYGIDDANRPSPEALIDVTEIVDRHYTPLLPVIYFDSGSATIPSRYGRLDEESARNFNYFDVAELAPLPLSHTVLNILGLRMQDDPDGKLLLYGSQSDDEPPSLATERARAVRDYLVNVWKVPPHRIEVRNGTGSMTLSNERTADGRDENRRVSIESPTGNLLAPLATERTVREFNPPRIRIVPTYSAHEGVERWKVVVRQNGTALAEFADRDSLATISDISWRLDGRGMHSPLGALVADLTVVDSLGQTAHASDSIVLRLRQDSQVVESYRERNGNAERIYYNLMGFDYKSAAGNPSHQREIRDIARQIRRGARVSITGYTDRIGDDRSNVELSRARAEYVAAQIRTALPSTVADSVVVTVRGAGVDLSRYANDLPEGRVLSRGATVVIDQTSEPTNEP